MRQNLQGKLEEAMVLRERCLKIEEKALGENHPQVAASLNNKAALLTEMVSVVEDFVWLS